MPGEGKDRNRLQNDYKAQISSLQAQLANLQSRLPVNQTSTEGEKAQAASGGFQRIGSITAELHQICGQIRQLCEQRSGGE